MLFRSAMVVGIALVRTVYCLAPILAKPEGSVRFCSVDRVDDVGRGQALWPASFNGSMSTMICRYLPPSGVKNLPGNRCELLAQAIDAIVVQLLLVETVGGQGELQDRNAGGIVLHDDRRLDSDRHERADRIRCRNDLRDGEIQIDVRLEVNLLHGNAVEPSALPCP